VGIFHEKYTADAEVFDEASCDMPPRGWRTLSAVPVSKIPKQMKRVDKLKKSGEEKLVWVKVTTSAGIWDVKPKEPTVWWDHVEDGTVGIVIVRDGRVIGVVRLREPSYFHASIHLKWSDLGIFTITEWEEE